MPEFNGQSNTPRRYDLPALLQRRFQSSREVRRGICLLNAGAFDQAADAFSEAVRLSPSNLPLLLFLAACYSGLNRFGDAVQQFRNASKQRPHRTDIQIREAHALHASGRSDEAIGTLRRGIAENPENAELHFQLGTLLSAQEDYEEAELRFTQAINLDKHHTEARVSLAMCCGLRGTPDEALKHLHQAQARRPGDARIGMLLAQAAKAASDQGHKVGLCATMPSDKPELDAQGMEELSRVIEKDPDFVDAFLSIPVENVQERLFALLLDTIRVALERQPEQAELHFHCGRVLEKLGRQEDAIDANEIAVRINPRFTRALVELAKLYHATDRKMDAMTRLQQAVAAGAEYADVYYMLGNLYRDQGDLEQARSAYDHALRINKEYIAAHKALAMLPA